MNDLVAFAVLGGLLTNILTMTTVAWKGIMTLLSLRDAFRDMSTKIGTRFPPEGLLGDMEAIKTSHNEIKEHISDTNTKIAVIESGLAKRRSTDT